MKIFIILWIVSLYTLQRSESLYVPQPLQSTSRCTVLMRYQSNGRCDCCSDDDEEEGCNALLVELPKPTSILHTSRRKFIQYTTTLGITGVSSSSHAETISDASRFDQSKNIIAVPGALPPFSTTRTYRHIVLSNGLKVILVKDLRCTSSSVAISIDGAGQFAEPDEIPGLAHLMEHIVLSSTRGRSTKVLDRRPRDFWNKGSKTIREEDTTESESFEDWLIDNDGDSNAFTGELKNEYQLGHIFLEDVFTTHTHLLSYISYISAPGFVCFHFNSPHEVLPEALERFSKLFTLDEVETTLSKPSVIPREIGRVADELDRTSDLSRSIYFLKNSINSDHPFARFSAGSLETLQTIPNEEGIDVASELALFFRDHYLSSKATLVVIGRDELSALDRWISPFSNVMSQKVGLTEKLNPPLFPDPMLGSNKQAIILRNTIDDVQVDENYQTLCMEWPLSLSYDATSIGTGSSSLITATSLGFVLTQIISRRGPGSLRQFLEKLGYVPRGNKGVPRISFPVDVNGFQILRLEIGGITLDGFANRSALVSTVFESIRKTIETPLQADLIKEYLVAAQLHGYFFAPRAADAITLSVDSLRFGSGGTNGVANEDYNWYLMPSPEDNNSVLQMRQLVTETLYTMSDESSSLVSFRASPKAVFTSSQGIIDERISTPPVFLPWQREPITGTRFYIENRASGASAYLSSLEWFASVFDGEELSPPYLNPLLPTRIRSPRPIIERQVGQWGGSRYLYQDASDDDNLARSSGKKLKLSNAQTWREYTSGFSVDSVESRWRLFLVPPNKASFIGLPLPLRPPGKSAF